MSEKNINTLANSKHLNQSMMRLMNQQIDGYRTIQNKSSILIAVVSLQIPFLYVLFGDVSYLWICFMLPPLITLLFALIMSIQIVFSLEVDVGLSPEKLIEYQDLPEEEFLDKITEGYWGGYNDNQTMLTKLGKKFNYASYSLIGSVIYMAIIFIIQLYV
jgi:hypothetical protein